VWHTSFGKSVAQADGIHVLVDNVAGDERNDTTESKEFVLDERGNVGAEVAHFEGDPATLHEAVALLHALFLALHDHFPQVVT
jgi:hypothetical protein